VENIEGGVKYIKELLGAFGGNVAYAVAAYNAGPAAVRKYGGIPPYQETRTYVKRVMEYYQKHASKE
jgi:soluble lytic murein transglycosylase-like protein